MSEVGEATIAARSAGVSGAPVRLFSSWFCPYAQVVGWCCACVRMHATRGAGPCCRVLNLRKRSARGRTLRSSQSGGCWSTSGSTSTRM